jgi:hypothetical protein
LHAQAKTRAMALLAIVNAAASDSGSSQAAVLESLADEVVVSMPPMMGGEQTMRVDIDIEPLAAWWAEHAGVSSEAATEYTRTVRDDMRHVYNDTFNDEPLEELLNYRTLQPIAPHVIPHQQLDSYLRFWS